MQDSVGLAVVGLAVIASISVAVVVEWIGLWGLMKLMPMPEEVEVVVLVAAETNVTAASAVGQMEVDLTPLAGALVVPALAPEDAARESVLVN